MRTYSIIDMLASFLAVKPEFQEGRFTLYSEVPIKCIAKNGRFCKSTEGENCLDLVVCRGEEIVLGIVYDKNRMRIVNTLLPRLPYVVVPDENWLPLSVDDTPPDCPTPECLKALYHTVLAWLPRAGSHAGSAPAPRTVYMGQTANQGAWKYTLPAVPVAEVLGNDTGDSLRDLLIQKCLLISSGVTSGYGKACGLFIRYSQSPLKTALKEYVTIGSLGKGLETAVTWKGDSGRRAKLPLSQRLHRLGIASSRGSIDSSQALSQLNHLLRMPLEELFAACPDTLRKMTNALSCMEADAFGSSSRAKEIHTYQDALDAVFAIWRNYSDDCRYGNLCSQKFLQFSDTVMLCLSEPFLTPAVGAQANAQKRRSLKPRLKALQPKVSLSLAHAPLSQYYYAAACYANCNYPNWLYNNLICSFLMRLGIPAANCDLAALIRHIHESRGDNDGNLFLILYALLVEPICRPKAGPSKKI